MKQIVILYHDGCTDGFSAAWAAWKKFGNKADYIAVNHQEPHPKGLKGREIYMVDFTYPESIVKRMIKENKRVTSIDHHAIKKNAILMTHAPLFDNNHSGAVLAWKYFHPRKPVPRFLLHVEDEDLWRFKLPHTKEIRSASDLYEFDFKLWDKIAAAIQDKEKKKDFIKKGEIILKYESEMIRGLTSRADAVMFNGIKTLAVNSPVLNSQIGHALYRKLPPMGIIWKESGGVRKISLRSNGSIDVSKIAAKYGGGGHKTASSFNISAKKPLPWRRV